MACFESAGADFEQEWCQQDEVVPADEDDLDVPPALAKLLQAASRGHSPEAAAKYHDPGLFRHRHVTPHRSALRRGSGPLVSVHGPVLMGPKTLPQNPLENLAGATLRQLGVQDLNSARNLVIGER